MVNTQSGDSPMISRPGTTLLAISATILTLHAQPVYAYLDPGTGSIILQSMLAGIAVAAGMLRMYWHQFKAFCARLTGSASAREPSSNDRGGDSESPQ